jgi:tetratricopeptide (TPR) repeat protein
MLLRHQLIIALCAGVLFSSGLPIFAVDSETAEKVQTLSPKWMKLRQQADQATEKGMFADAEANYTQLLKERFDLGLETVAERTALADMFVKSGNAKKAEEMYRGVVAEREQKYGQNDWLVVFPLNNLAMFLEKTGRAEEAKQIRDRVAVIEKSAKEPPKTLVAAISEDAKMTAAEKSEKLRKIGQELLEKDQAKNSIYVLEKALGLDTSNVEAAYQCANAYLQMEDDSKAKKLLDGVLKTNPQHAGALVSRAHIYQHANKLQDALKDYDAAIAAKPDDHDTRGWRAKLHLQLGQHQKAVDDYTEILKTEKHASWPLVQRGLAYQEMGKYDLALADFKTLTDRYPERWENFELAGNANLKAKNLQAALADYTKVVTLAPHYAGGYKMRAEVYKLIEGPSSRNAAQDLAKAEKPELRSETP